MIIIPAIDLIGGKTVRLEQGQYDRKISYDIDPVEAAIKWQKAGAEILHVVDLDGAKEGKPVNLSIVEKIVDAIDIPVQTGGGYRSIEEIRKALSIGVWRVIVGSKAMVDRSFVSECVKKFNGKIIFSVDAKNFTLCTQGWEKEIKMDFFAFLKELRSTGIGEIIYTDISKDGTLEGPAIGNIEKILDEVKMKVISAGGVKDTGDIRKLKRLESKGLMAVIIGRALYDGTIDLKEAIRACKTDNPVS
ncbi:MAG: 1-(5-phosphoribosyl)-5-[(5-phosphoribosylamino)methylideneamino]imidazole-4-carboxamide isomerase [Candidatus Omnitrophica bacterium]|nr:1-(5-phosphoribosyl)-5-[(5-phosphoribosylamino)methylideneamino]imidazole-4-carboxamide isomerase [Candidatus Omnitrophota bacterium]